MIWKLWDVFYWDWILVFRFVEQKWEKKNSPRKKNEFKTICCKHAFTLYTAFFSYFIEIFHSIPKPIAIQLISFILLSQVNYYSIRNLIGRNSRFFFIIIPMQPIFFSPMKETSMFLVVKCCDCVNLEQTHA